MFTSALLVKYFGHCNQAFVKFVVISSWPDPYNKKIGSNQTSLSFVVCVIQTIFLSLTQLVKCNSQNSFKTNSSYLSEPISARMSVK